MILEWFCLVCGDPNLNRVSSINYQGGAYPYNVSFAYDAVGNRTQMTDATGTTTYTIDALDRLKQATFPGSKTVKYAYDAVGNVQTLSFPGSTCAAAKCVSSTLMRLTDA